EVLLHDLERAVARLGEDVDRAGFGELCRQRRVRDDPVVDLDGDEEAVGPHRTPAPAEVPDERSAILARIISGISSMRSATAMPAAARRAIFSEAVSSLPSTIVPACPKLMPGISSMKRPAMKATIGNRDSFASIHRESSASMRPPGSV